MCWCYLVLFVAPCGNWVSENQLQTILLSWIIKSIVSYPEISSAGSHELWQTNCRQDKVEMPSEFRKIMGRDERWALQAAESASVCPREDMSVLPRGDGSQLTLLHLFCQSLTFATVPPHSARSQSDHGRGKKEHLLFPEGVIANLRTHRIYLTQRLRQRVQEWHTVPGRDIVKDNTDKQGPISQSNSQNSRSDQRK